MTKVIKSDSGYEAALDEVDALMDLDPDVGTDEADRLELLTLLLEDYESKNFHFSLPDPIAAIEFRMEQENLSQRDLVPYLGSRSKVSEVLSRKRSLSLSMIRALHSGLGIPAEVLLQDRNEYDIEEDESLEWDKFPIKEMISRGWINVNMSLARQRPEEVLRQYFAPLGPLNRIHALYRKTEHVRSARPMDMQALFTWTAQIMIRSKKNPPLQKYHKDTVNLPFMQEVAKLSLFEQGPLLAREYLRKHGIDLVIERHLPRTYLDGAAIMDLLERPIIGLSLRYDRIDNFWFSLMHELAHIALHFDLQVTHFYDDLDVDGQGDPREKEADDLASEALIPESVWKKSAVKRVPSQSAAQILAKDLGIHPAIVAGRARHESNSYRILNNLVGHNEVRKCFPDIEWS